MIRFGSVCSGIEAASVAFAPLGWKAAWLSEVGPAPSRILAHRFPDVPNLGDMRCLPGLILSESVEAPDALVGGTPCQSFSMSGNRESMNDERGALTLSFVQTANAIDTVRERLGLRPCVILWENVRGVLRTHDNAFGCFVAALAGESTPYVSPGGRWEVAGVAVGPRRTVAWRLLNAQHFGHPQRRNRVFVVASADPGFDPAAVLFEA